MSLVLFSGSYVNLCLICQGHRRSGYFLETQPWMRNRMKARPTPLTPFRSPFSRLSRGKLMMLFMFCICKQEVHKSSNRTGCRTGPWELQGYPHQVLEERCQFFGKNSEPEEGRADLGILPADQVFSELLHGLDVLVLIVHVSWNREQQSFTRSEAFRFLSHTKN